MNISNINFTRETKTDENKNNEEIGFLARKKIVSIKNERKSSPLLATIPASVSYIAGVVGIAMLTESISNYKGYAGIVPSFFSVLQSDTFKPLIPIMDITLLFSFSIYYAKESITLFRGTSTEKIVEKSDEFVKIDLSSENKIDEKENNNGTCSLAGKKVSSVKYNERLLFLIPGVLSAAFSLWTGGMGIAMISDYKNLSCSSSYPYPALCKSEVYPFMFAGMSVMLFSICVNSAAAARFFFKESLDRGVKISKCS